MSSMTSRPALPIVLVTACNRMLGDHPFHIAGRKYVEAVRLAGAMPLVVPSARPEEIEPLLALADGVLLTGSPSNVHPSHFDEDVHDVTLPLDPVRDEWTLPFIRRALALGVPILGICRGTQETNVALGGTLYQAVQEAAGDHGPYADHRGQGETAESQYAPAHPVDVLPGGVLATILGEDRVTVNSVHGQAVKRLAPGLRVEARAPDGLIEAFSAPDAPGFNLCLQWHPEWKAADNAVSMKILRAFGDAVRAWRDRPRTPLPAR